MKKYIMCIALILSGNFASALSEQDQRNALTQLEIARNEIKIVKDLMPSFARKIVGGNLKNADHRIEFAQQVLAMAPVGGRYYCVVKSSFDGDFAGRGSTELEAKNNAYAACKQGSRNSGFFCKPDEAVCQVEN